MPLESALLSAISKAVPRDLLYVEPAAPPESAISFRWLGAAGFEICARGHRVLLDPFLSRPGFWATLSGHLRPDEAACARIGPADAIFAGHSHHDHAMDIGVLGRKQGVVYGSESALHLARLDGVPRERLRHIAPDDVVETGPFKVRVLRSVHGKLLGGAIPTPGRIGDPPGPLRLRQYRVGATFGLQFDIEGVRFFHLGSADFVEAALQDVQCDVLLLCIVGRKGSPRFVERILKTLQPKVVLPCHWDVFLLPTEQPAREIPGVHVARFFDEVEAARPQTDVALLDFFAAYRYPLPATVPSPGNTEEAPC
jgi:L-ascorbate metabolism protein UlaG (beta-lactamase superfamily)